MANKSEKLHAWGTTLSCLGGLFVIFSFDQDSTWGLELSLLAVIFALLGIYLINKAQKEEN